MATYQEQLEKLRARKEVKAKAKAESTMSLEQIKNWRIVLANMGIPFAMSMPDDAVQMFRDGLQAGIMLAAAPASGKGRI